MTQRPPLSQWTCDRCGELTDGAEQTIVIWREDARGRASNYQMAHKERCDPGSSPSGDWESVDELIGDSGLARLLSMLSLGPLKRPHPDMPQPVDMDEFVDLVRRLHTPWYEEARGRFKDDDVRESMSDANEVHPYLPETLEEIARSGE